MRRVIKAEGKGQILVEEVPIPEVEEDGILVRTHVSAISAGSELGGRYTKEEAVSPDRIGYLAAGEVVAIGRRVTQFKVGDRVRATAPHAEYVHVKTDRAIKLPDGLSFEAAAVGGLTTSAVRWLRLAAVQPHESVVILGQGLVGSILLQTLIAQGRPKQIIAVDGHELRCEKARRLGADHVLNFKECDVAASVAELTNGELAHVVLDAVGGPAGVKSFGMAQRLIRVEGRLILVGLYHNSPLTLDPGFLARRKVVGANCEMSTWHQGDIDESIVLLAAGAISTEEMVSHRFSFEQAKEAFDLLYERPQEAMVVVLEWPPAAEEQSAVSG